jgi:ribose 5-phosphate isomerase RpiB
MHVASAQSKDMDADDLSQVDEAILDELHNGQATKGALVDWTGYSRNSIYNRLEVLEAAEVVVCIHDGTRLFKLQNDPRE